MLDSALNWITDKNEFHGGFQHKHMHKNVSHKKKLKKQAIQIKEDSRSYLK